MSTLRVGDLNIHYQVQGEGRDVVLIHGLSPRLPAITTPTLILAGAGDLNVRPAQVWLVLLRGARHLPMDEHPQALYRELKAILTAATESHPIPLTA